MKTEWILNPKQEQFVNSESRYLCYWGGRGCVSGETLIYDAENKKEIEIEVLYKEKKPIKVLSVKNGQIIKAQALMPVRYGKKPLYRLKTDNRTIVATREHKFLTKNGWKKLSELSVGEQLQGVSPSLQESTSESYLSILYVNAFRLFGRVQDFLFYCQQVFRLNDEQPLLEKGSVLSVSPLEDDVHEHNRLNFYKGGQETLLKHNHSYQLLSHLSRNSSSPLSATRHFSYEVNRIFFGVYQYILDSLQVFQRFVLKIVFVLIKVPVVLLSILYFSYKFLLAYLFDLFDRRPLPHTTTKKETIKEIKYERTDYYYDLHILGTNNYLAQGVFNHNCGKSLAVVLKIIKLMLRYPKNYGLLGRYNYSDLKDSTMKDFFDVCPESYIKTYNKQERMVTFFNGSQLIFRGLKDVTKQNVRSLNLGFAVLEQAEEIDEDLVMELDACLRRQLLDYDGKQGIQQFMAICNPAVNWIYRKFVQEENDNYELIEGSMMDNMQNLPQTFIKSQMAKPESWKQVFVYGKLDKNLLSQRGVFPQEYIENQEKYINSPIRKIEDIDIFTERESHIYQIGVDPSEGLNDYSVVKAINTFTGEEVASFSKRMPPDLLAFKVVTLGKYLFNARVVLEINGIGLATLTKLKDLNYANIYVREEFDKHAKVMTKRLGWKTTHVSKPLLTGHFTELIADTDEDGRKKEPFIKVKDVKTLEEMKTFEYSDLAKKKGMGASSGFHDDKIMALMLACVDIKGDKVADSKDVVVLPENEYDDDKEILHIEQFINKPKEQSWLEL